MTVSLLDTIEGAHTELDRHYVGLEGWEMIVVGARQVDRAAVHRKDLPGLVLMRSLRGQRGRVRRGKRPELRMPIGSRRRDLCHP